MKRALLLLALGACVKPNGKQHQLYFGLELPEGTGTGLSQDLLLPDSRQSQFSVDFEGTDIAANGAGLEIVESVHLAGGAWRLRVRCGTGPEPVTRELDVVVSAGGKSRYEDQYDLTCLRSQGLVVTSLLSTDFPYPVGANATLHAHIDADDAKNVRIVAVGHGFVVLGADPIAAVVEDVPGVTDTEVTLLTLKPGIGVRVVAGAIEGDVPLQVIDDSLWRLAVPLEVADAGPGLTRVRATAFGEDLDGGTVWGALPCTFTVSSGGTVLATSPEGPCGGAWTVDAGSGQVCASALRHQGCATF